MHLCTFQQSGKLAAELNERPAANRKKELGAGVAVSWWRAAAGGRWPAARLDSSERVHVHAFIHTA
jgi:hypothetical protein